MNRAIRRGSDQCRRSPVVDPVKSAAVQLSEDLDEHAPSLGVDGVRRTSYERVYSRFTPLESALCPGEAPSDRAWSRRAIRLPQDSTIRGQPGGTGIVIGHPDTGWADHPELEPGLLDLSRQWSTLTQQPDASDPMRFPLFKGHGTSTASVLASRSAGEITGVDPGATVIPIRCIESVAVVLDVEVARAVRS